MTDTVSQPPCPAASGASSGKGVRNKPGVWDVANIAEKASPFSSIFLSPAFAQQFSALFPLSSLLRRVFFRHERLRKEARPHGWGRRSPAVPPKEFGLPRPFSQSVTCPTSPPHLFAPCRWKHATHRRTGLIPRCGCRGHFPRHRIAWSDRLNVLEPHLSFSRIRLG